MDTNINQTDAVVGDPSPRACSRILFRSAVSGLWYQNRGAAGDIDAVEVDGARIFQGYSEPNTVWEMRSSRWIAHVSSANSELSQPDPT